MFFVLGYMFITSYTPITPTPPQTKQADATPNP